MLNVRECLAVHRDVGRGRLQERACYVLYYIPIYIDISDIYYDSGSTGMGSTKGTTRYVGSCRRTALSRMWVGWERGLTAAHKLGKAQMLE